MKEAIRNARRLHFFDRPGIIGLRLLLRQATLPDLWMTRVQYHWTEVQYRWTPPKVL